MENIIEERTFFGMPLPSVVRKGPGILVRKKVLIITPYNPEGIGGAETFTLQLIDAIKDHVEVDLLTCPVLDTAWDQPTFMDCFKLMMHLLPRAIWRMIRKRYDTVHCLGLIATSVGVFLKCFFGVRLISTTLALYDVGKLSVLKYNIASLIFSQANVVLVEDYKGREEMIYLRVRRWRIKEFTHWVDLDRFKPGRPQHKTMHILFVGRPIEKKGIDIIKEVERTFKLHKLKAVFTYVENVPYSDLHDYYRRADVFVIPSLYEEGVARVVLEAAASGCAVVASDRGSLRRLVKPFGIVLFPNAGPFKRAILGLYDDRKLLANYKQASRVYAMQHFSAKNAEGFLNEY